MVEDIIDGINHGLIYAPSLPFVYIYIYMLIEELCNGGREE
jgi:hypothetical protein